MAIRQRGDSWQVSVTVSGVRRRKDCPTIELAEALEKEWMAAPAAPVIGMVPKAVRDRLHTVEAKDVIATFGPLVEHVYRERWSKGRNGEGQYRNAKQARDFFGADFKLTDFSTHWLSEFSASLEKQGNANGTINRKLCAVSVALEFAKKSGWIVNVPPLPERKKEVGYRTRVVSAKEEADALKVLAHWGRDDLADLFVVLVDTGLRVDCEALALRRADVLEVPKPAVQVREGKFGKPRLVPLTKRAKAAIDRRIEAATLRGDDKLFPFSYRSLMEKWEALRETLKLDATFVPHCCRHTCASRLADMHVPAQQIQKWLGHASIVTTMRYVHASAASLFTGVDALDSLQKQTKDAAD